MLTAVSGYIEDNKVIVEENITEWQGRNVIVTILDSAWDGQASKDTQKTDDEKKKKAALELAGLWKDHENELSVDDMVRNMRRGR